jgi:hypothetical protein
MRVRHEIGVTLGDQAGALDLLRCPSLLPLRCRQHRVASPLSALLDLVFAGSASDQREIWESLSTIA